ncbi:ShlB/FhaC/HecB family hemolysin secretion/activation protein [Endomicrobium proavitum]|uniref:ShlB/FhaC/HecB family hemolysin secretion/activation protein n=1 Tax=Endomicrobium proavitum TaxID=1408281 RepID=A0A0G3WHT9_9BACT|nr:ShlB/FhaC/HecB family hemolysin secretion/activation protein [Endomicrobium proavitum]AKL98236.1 exported protein of unknown function [Endomicrobium proavitum]
MKNFFTALLLFFINVNVYAAVTDDIQRNIDSHYNELIRQQEIDNRTNFIKDSYKEPQYEPANNTAKTNKKQFKKIEITNSDIPGVSQSAINNVLDLYKQKMMGIQEISEIQEKLQKLFFDAGYASARVYIDGNTLNDDILTFVVMDGYIEDVVFQNAAGKKYPKFFNALQSFSFYPFAAGSLLNIADIDQGLEQMNRLASNNASMEILPASKDGYSVIRVTNDIGKRFNLSFSADNSGTENTGYYKAGVSISADNLLMLNDNLYFNYSRNIDGNKDDKRNNGYFASFSVPFGYFTFMTSFFKSDYNTPMGVSFGSQYVSDGTTQNENASLEVIVKRGQTYKISLGGELSVKETENFIDNIRIDASSKKLTVSSGFLTFLYYLNASSIYGKLSYNCGLNWLGAIKNYDIEGSPKGQFSSVSLYTQYSQYFKIPLIQLQSKYALTANGHYCDDILYSSEQISIGGQSSVRGFKEGSVNGEKGFYLKNDLTWTLADIFQRNGIFNVLAYTSISGFADYGYVQNLAYKEKYSLAGAGAGAAFRAKYINAGVYWSRSVYNKSHLPNEGDVVYFNIEGKIYF